MRNRLLWVLAALTALAVTGFGFPLASSIADARTQQFVLSRDSDLQRFVGLASGYVTTGSSGSLFDEMRIYHQLYGDKLAVVSTKGMPSHGEGISPDAPALSESVSRALRNQAAADLGALTPWGPDEVVFAKPVGTDGQLDGAVLIVSSTRAAKADIGQQWLYIFLGMIAALLAFGVLAVAVSRWVLRPLELLSRRLRRLTASLPFGVPAKEPHPAPDTELARQGPPELRALAQSFEQMAAAVERSSLSQRRLVADAAHQLRNPLAALQLRLDFLEPHVSSAGHTNYERATAESLRFTAILDDLLALATAEAPLEGGEKQGARCVPFSVAADRTGFWQGPAAVRGVQLTFDGGASYAESAPSGPATAAAITEAALGQVLDVLIDNACKYAGAGAHVRVSCASAPASDGMMAISVADNGPGVSADQRARLTERFYRGASSADRTGSGRPGTGLGLAIADALLASFGGSLEFSATPGGGGLTAVVRLPAAPRRDAQHHPAESGPGDGAP
ncbi:HAMP domain-containing sensor histidine kinase [Pseudarthrobacter sulfonivorans]|uniref:sensor histidine kinase n=1 Tax=Pseudarthrobacter sulfonivorans TaxID=121292 RepID=UPI002861F09A|nr:HAMP domain-containing sensor histidine kinase [Pseudarthrobacter sulfonivorans]MDR6415714.1 signal transduction histidine kinase [Pseudarthrobacter sulfonivorans]